MNCCKKSSLLPSVFGSESFLLLGESTWRGVIGIPSQQVISESFTLYLFNGLEFPLAIFSVTIRPLPIFFINLFLRMMRLSLRVNFILLSFFSTTSSSSSTSSSIFMAAESMEPDGETSHSKSDTHSSSLSLRVSDGDNAADAKLLWQSQSFFVGIVKGSGDARDIVSRCIESGISCFTFTRRSLPCFKFFNFTRVLRTDFLGMEASLIAGSSESYLRGFRSYVVK
mmetsp:Transcript_21210/g.26004  ORF Transcript_21210/g.26004 Transcript_21210/m.26004 type:complete len:226 (-) Transcript_21210:726-1403(-)